jgi:hypothetical protein
MAKCLTCDKEFYNGSYADMIRNWEESYCNKHCWETSEEYTELEQKFKKWYKTLDAHQQEIFKILNDELFFDEDYTYLTDEWIKED